MNPNPPPLSELNAPPLPGEGDSIYNQEESLYFYQCPEVLRAGASPVPTRGAAQGMGPVFTAAAQDAVSNEAGDGGPQHEIPFPPRQSEGADQDGPPLTFSEMLEELPNQEEFDAFLSEVKSDMAQRYEPLFVDKCAKLLTKYAAAFIGKRDKLTSVRGAKHVITLKEGAKPFHAPLRRSHPKQRAVIETELQKLLDRELIVPIESPWASPLLMVPKKNPGEWRFCIDFRRLNALTVKSSYPFLG